MFNQTLLIDGLGRIFQRSNSMSYSLFDNCHNCINREACTDKPKIRAAIDGIHATGLSATDGHMGSGSIIIHCQNHDQ
jgi:hypothetical protein